MILAGILSDYIIRKNFITRRNSRRLFNDIGNCFNSQYSIYINIKIIIVIFVKGMFVPMISMIGISFITSKYSFVAVILLTIGIGFM
jgi:hypothetical protein